MFQFCCLDVHRRVPCRRLQVPGELSLLGKPGGSTAAAFTEQGQVTGGQGQRGRSSRDRIHATQHDVYEV